MRPRSLVPALALGLAALLSAGCSSTTPTAGPGTSAPSGGSAKSAATAGPTGSTMPAGGACPTTAMPIVVSVDQWGDIVKQLAGECAEVTTIITSSSADPHEYEPTPADNAKFTGAKLVVVNGVDYDPWAVKAVDALSTKPIVINGGEVVGAAEGANPHIWYSPTYVDQVSAAVTTELSRLAPGGAAYFDQQAAAWKTAIAPYRDEIAKLEKISAGKTYAATESVFDYMAQAVGLEDLTPQGYQNAAANESDPGPGDVNDFQQALKAKKINVLVFNTQTEGAIPEQIRDTATSASVPVVNVTETVPPDATSFVQWQVSQLQQLEKALS